MNPVIIVVAVLVLGVVAFAIARRKHSNDGVDSFRRQIDALSPEARRSVVDQVQKSAERRVRDGDDAGRDGPHGA